MNRILIIVVAVAVLIGFIWFGLAGPDMEEASPASDVPVHVAKIVRTTLRGYVTAYGTVEPEPAGERPAASVRLAPTVPGVVVAVHAVEGQRVSKGDVLFELDSRAADVAVSFARKTVEREMELMQAGGTSTKALQQAEQQLDDALVQQAFLRVASPLSGTITHVNVKPGEAVDLTTVLAAIIDLDRLVVSAGVPDAESAALEPGQPAEVFAGKEASPIPGTLTYVGTGVDVTTGTVPLRASPISGSGLRPGQFVGVRIVTVEHQDCLAVPIDSVTRDDDGETVIAVVENDTAVQTRVTAGLRDGDLIEIEAEGLRPGMTVVTQGAYALPKDSKVRVIGN